MPSLNILCPICGYGNIKQIDDEYVCDYCYTVFEELPGEEELQASDCKEGCSV